MAPKRVLMVLCRQGFDPSESAVPWRILKSRGIAVEFTTPDGKPGRCDPILISGEGIGPAGRWLRADAVARAAYAELERDPAYLAPRPWAETRAAEYDALFLPGGHAPESREYLTSPTVHAWGAEFLLADRPLAAVCHGVLTLARARDPRTGRSPLHGRTTTALRRDQELGAWLLTRAWAGDYYRTDPTPVETEVRANLASPADFFRGPPTLRKDSPGNLAPGFVHRDRQYLSARWPGDVHRLGTEFAELILGAR